MTGDMEEAVRVTLAEHLSEPLAIEVQRVERLRIPVFAELTANPRVAARMGERDKELDQAREEVREMLLQPEWNP